MDLSKNDFWKYSFSDLLDNRNRASFGEFIVASALDTLNKPPETSWEDYDVRLPLENGRFIRVEVKTSGYIQRWVQKKASVISFDIAQKRGWVGDGTEMTKNVDRHSDVYVFCLHKEEYIDEKSKKDTNPLDMDNWCFYVVPTALINEKLETQKSVRISTIKGFLGIEEIGYTELKGKLIDLDLLES